MMAMVMTIVLTRRGEKGRHVRISRRYVNARRSIDVRVSGALDSEIAVFSTAISVRCAPLASSRQRRSIRVAATASFYYVALRN